MGDLAVLTAGEPGIEQVLLGASAELFEAGGFAAPRRPPV
jgi:hypothetical protein